MIKKFTTQVLTTLTQLNYYLQYHLGRYNVQSVKLTF